MYHPDYIPDADGAFQAFQRGFTSYALANLAGLLSPAQLAALAAQQAEWESAHLDNIAAQNAAKEAAAAKRAARAAYRRTIRQVSALVRADPSTTDDVRVSLGIPVRDRIRTRRPVPDSVPRLLNGGASGQSIRLGIIDEETKRRRKPEGVYACEVFVKVGGDAPSDIDDCRFLGLSTDGKFEATFEGDAIGQPAHFLGRWVNTRGEHGPRGQVLTVIVPI